MAPRFDAKLNSSIIAVRRPLGEVNRVQLPGTAEHPQGSQNRNAISNFLVLSGIFFFLVLLNRRNGTYQRSQQC